MVCSKSPELEEQLVNVGISDSMVIEVYVHSRRVSAPGETEDLLLERWNLQWYRSSRTGEMVWTGWSHSPIEKTIVVMLRRVAVTSRATQLTRLFKKAGYGEQFELCYKITQRPSTLHFGPTDATKEIIFHGHKGHMYLHVGNQCSLSFSLSYRHNLWTPPTLPTHIAPMTILDNYVSRSATPPQHEHSSIAQPSSSAPRSSTRLNTGPLPSSASPSHITITPPYQPGAASSHAHPSQHYRQHSGGSHSYQPTSGYTGSLERRPTPHLHHPPSSQSPELDEYSIRLQPTSLPRQEYLEQHYHNLHHPSAHPDPISPRSLTGGSSGHASPSLLGQSPAPGTSPSDSSFMRPVRGRSTSTSASQILGSTSISPYRIDLNSTMARSPPMPTVGSASNQGLPLDMIGPSGGRIPSSSSIGASPSPAPGSSYPASQGVVERLTSGISFGNRDTHLSPNFGPSSLPQYSPPAEPVSFGYAPARSRYSVPQESSQDAWSRVPPALKPAVVVEEMRNILTITPLSFDHSQQSDFSLFQEVLSFHPNTQRS